MEVKIKGFGEVKIKYLLFDLNGTLSVGGKLKGCVVEKFKILRDMYEIYILTADTFGVGRELSEKLRVNFKKVDGEREDLIKLKFLEELGPDLTVAIGNGNNDAPMLKKATIGISVVGGEGASLNALLNSDMVFKDICDVLDSLINPKRIVATLRR